LAARIHPTAVIDPAAELSDDVEVGPYALVGPNVRLGPGVRIHGHAVVDGHTTLEAGVEVFPFAAIGLRPQDKKYDGGPSRLRVGPKSILREYVTVQPAASEGRATVVGAGVLIMAYGHVAHDCVVGDGVVMANAVQLAGHCEVHDGAVLGGLTNVHQYARIGRLAMTGAAARVSRDVPPFALVDGHPARYVGPNVVGLRRAGLPPATRAALKRALRRVLTGPREAACTELEGDPNAPPEVEELLAFVRASTRGLTRPRRRGAPRPHPA